MLVSVACAATAFVLFVYSLYCICDRHLARRLAFGTGAMIAILALSARAASLPALLDYVSLLQGRAERPASPGRVATTAGPAPAAIRIAVAPAPPDRLAGLAPPVAIRTRPPAGSVTDDRRPRGLRREQPEAPPGPTPRLEHPPRPERSAPGGGSRAARPDPVPASMPPALAAPAPERLPRERPLPAEAARDRGEVPRAPERGEPRQSTEQTDGTHRPDHTLRVDRAERLERVERLDAVSRPALDRPERVERPDRPAGARLERLERIDRPDRRERFERVDRPDRFERPERRERLDRMERQRPERLERRPDR